MNIVTLACDVVEAVEVFREKARRFFYSVMLLGHRCPKCNGSLAMMAEGKCWCDSCGARLDPTVAFQRCSACGGVPVLQVRRYKCRDCGTDIQSVFLFDGLVFDGEYFRQKMVESRQRRKEQRENIHEMLGESRSGDLPLEHMDLNAVPGLLEALNALTAGLDESLIVQYRERFDLKRYESHVRAHLQDYPMSLARIPPLGEDLRKDLIWRFIAVIFLAHVGVADVMQEGQEIMVMKHETDRER